MLQQNIESRTAFLSYLSPFGVYGIVFEGKLPNINEVMLISTALTRKYNVAFIENFTSQEQTTKGDI